MAVTPSVQAYQNETGSRLNTDNPSNEAAQFRDDDDSALPAQYESYTIQATSADGVILSGPTGATAPAVAEQTSGSPGSGAQHFLNPILYNNLGYGDRRHRILVKVPAAMLSAGINTRFCTFIGVQNPNVGSNPHTFTGLHWFMDSSNTALHVLRMCRGFNNGNFFADSASGDTITETTDFTTGSYLLFVLQDTLPNGTGGGQGRHTFWVYNMGTTYTTAAQMRDWTNGTLIAQAGGVGYFDFNSTSLDDLTNQYGFCGCTISGTAVAPILVEFYSEQYSVPTLGHGVGAPTSLYVSQGATSPVNIPVQLGRSGNNEVVALTVSQSPTTTGITLNIATDIGSGTTGLVTMFASGSAGLGAGTFKLLATFSGGATAELTVNYTTVASLRSADLSVYLAGIPSNDGWAGSSTMFFASSAWKSQKDTRCQGGNNWTNPAYAAEASLMFGLATTRIDADWAIDISTGATSPCTTHRLVATCLSLGTRKIFTIPPVSNMISDLSKTNTEVKTSARNWLIFLLGHGFDLYLQEVGIRLAGPSASGTSASGTTVNELRCSGGTLSTTPGAYNGLWVTIEVATDAYEVAEIQSHTMDGSTLVLTLALQTGQTQALSAAHAAGAEVNIHANTIPNRIKTYNTNQANFLDSGHADYVAPVAGAALHLDTGNFVSSLWTLDNSDGLWTHQTATGSSNLAAKFVKQWSKAILSRATVSITPSTTTASVDFARTVNGADNYGEDVFPTNLIPETDTWSVFSGDGSINDDTGNFTLGSTSGEVRNTLTYTDGEVYGTATYSTAPAGGNSWYTLWGGFSMTKPGPASGGVAITPSDSTNVAAIIRPQEQAYLWVGTAGNVRVLTEDGEDLTIPCAAGSPLPLKVMKVFSTNTSASNIFLMRRRANED